MINRHVAKWFLSLIQACSVHCPIMWETHKGTAAAVCARQCWVPGAALTMGTDLESQAISVYLSKVLSIAANGTVPVQGPSTRVMLIIQITAIKERK